MGVPLRVLLVEDREDDAELTLRALRGGGYEPVSQRVDTAPALADALLTGTWDVILSDHRMPQFSSLEALRLLQDRDLDIPFLLVSGTIGEEAAVAVMRTGARDYILKSNLTRLPAAVGRELREAEERRARREAERKQREAEEKYRTLVEQIPAVTYITPAGERMTTTYVSPHVEALTGYPPSEWSGRPDAWTQALHPEDRERVLSELRRSEAAGGGFLSEYRLVGRDGQVVWIRDEARWCRDESTGVAFLQGFAVDVTDRKRAEETVQHLAYHDLLTGLPNSALLRERVGEAIEKARHDNRPLALLRLGLDRFRQINNTLGRETGDQVLREVGERLSELREADLVSRLGAAEFALLACGTDAAAAQRLAEKAIRSLQPPIAAHGLPVEVGASVGIAMFPGHGETPDLLLRLADVALDCARGNVSGSALYSKDQDPYDPRRLALLGELRTAIETDQLRLEYQPKIDLQSKRLVGVEALVRWRHPRLGNVRPDEFIGIAEESALIRPLTRWVLNEAFRQCRAWRQAGMELCVSANLSARNLQDPDLADQVESLLETWGAPPSGICLEITESAIMADPSRAALILERLSEDGVMLSIDDFGTGYSSLAYLRRLPVSEIKIDRSFVIGLSSNQGDLAIVRTVVDLGHHLNLKVVAEGVEDARTWDLLADASCDLAQGYYMARPMPASDLAGWIGRCEYGVAALPKDDAEDA